MLTGHIFPIVWESTFAPGFIAQGSVIQTVMGFCRQPGYVLNKESSGRLNETT